MSSLLLWVTDYNPAGDLLRNRINLPQMRSCTLIHRPPSPRRMNFTLLGWWCVKKSSGPHQLWRKFKGRRAERSCRAQSQHPWGFTTQIFSSRTCCRVSPASAPSDLPQHSPGGHAVPGCPQPTRPQQGLWNQVIPARYRTSLNISAEGLAPHWTSQDCLRIIVWSEALLDYFCFLPFILHRSFPLETSCSSNPASAGNCR